MKSPLEGITVLDLSHALAGPYCSTMLADYGADVIKIEPPTGDIARGWGVHAAGGETSYFVNLHRNKRSMTLDLKTPEGREVFFQLVEKADVVLENFRVGALARLGLHYEAACRRNPGIIYASISGYGQDGPYRDRPAMDTILQAEVGLISVTGEAGGRGVRCGVSIADITAGFNATIGVLLALRVKAETGQGQSIDVSMFEGQMSLLGNVILSYLWDPTHEVPVPHGTSTPGLLPYQTFRTASKDLALAVGSEKIWKAFTQAIGRPQWAADPRYHNNKARSQHVDELVDAIQAIFLTRPYEDWEPLLLEAGVPVGAVNNIAQMIDHPQVKARGSLVDIVHPVVGPVKIVGLPARLSRTPGSIRKASPRLGEDTDEILANVLGKDAGEIEALRTNGAFG